VGNIAPIANAGPSQAVQSRARVTLDGSNSYDLDGTVVSYAWAQISGPTVRLRDANTAMPQFRAPKVNKYPVVTLVFELTVTDDAGATGSDHMTISVLPRK
jgi:chitinase